MEKRLVKITRMKTMLVTLIAAISMATPAYAAKSTKADYVLTNGKIYTVNDKQRWAEAVAVKGNDIVYVGDRTGAKAFIGDKTVVTDLKGKMMLPGFIDTHSHTMLVMGMASGLMMDTPPDGKGDKDEMLRAVADYVKTNPDGPFFSFGGAFEGLVDITRHDIDKVIADRPFFMIAGTGHGGWANSKALEMAGVVKGKADPIDHFGREKDGTPTGYVGSAAAVFYTMGTLRLIPKEAVLANANNVLGASSAYGVTTAFQAGLLQGMEEVFLGALEQLEKTGKLPVRMSVVASFAQRPRHIEPSLANIKKFLPRYNSELLRVDALKIHGDGDMGGYTAGMLQPYADNPDKGLGMVSFPDQDQLTRFMLDSAKLGVDHIHMHAIGDRTLRQALDAFEQVRKAGYKDIRLSTGHTNLVHPDDLPRFKELDVIADLHAQYALPLDVYKDRLGEKVYRDRIFPVKTMARDGVRLTIGTDFPAGDENPFRSIAVVVSRREMGEREVLPPADEALSIEEAIQAFTINGAHVLGMETLIGSIEVGKRADLIILDRNILDASPEQIAQTRVLSTMMNGRVVYDETIGREKGAEKLVEVFEDFDFCSSIDEHDHAHN